MDINNFSFEADVSINPNALDVEWLEQPQTFMRYAMAAVDARDEMDRLKEEVDVVKAELDNKIRSAPEEFLGGAKVTNPAVDACILRSEVYQKAFDRYLQARKTYEYLMAGVRAMDMKKTALENLVRLQGQQYFSAPKEPRDLSSEYSKKQAHRAEAEDKVRKALEKPETSKPRRSK